MRRERKTGRRLIGKSAVSILAAAMICSTSITAHGAEDTSQAAAAEQSEEQLSEETVQENEPDSGTGEQAGDMTPGSEDQSGIQDSEGEQAATETESDDLTQSENESAESDSGTLLTAAVNSAGYQNEAAADAAGLRIQYDEGTTIHSIGSGNDTLILYCMNNTLHWPHTTPSISSVPTYSETTLKDFCAGHNVTYTDNLESELKALLYAGYPYNGFDLYQIVDTAQETMTDDEFNELLNPPLYLRDDFPDILGTTVFTLENSTSGENLDKLRQFTQKCYTYTGGKTTASGMTSAQLQDTAFWRAAYCVINYGASAKEAYVQFFISGYYVTAEKAYQATRDAVWQLLYQSGIPDNSGVSTGGLSSSLLNSSAGYKVLDKEPASDDISLSGDLSFYYNKTDGRWHTYPLKLSVPDNYNASFELVLPDGVEEESYQTQVNRNGSFSLVADDPASFTNVQLWLICHGLWGI